MGIPSYYKKLTDQLPTLVSRRHPEAAIAWLFMDFNCLIYHCLQQMPPYTGNDNKADWEAVLIENVTRYALKVIHDVSPKSGVVIAIDGVVPMAKMRQQRLRRFKSVWMTAHPQETDAVTTGPKWDTNAITPGTDFMKKLRIGLEKMISHKGRASWVLLSSDEPGEGEHKIMAEWRKGMYEGNYAVYGLDADLIVLSLLGQTLYGNRVWLFREEIDKGKMVYDSMGEEQFEWFSVEVLREWLSTGMSDTRAFMLNYCFAMSVLGNDFLPSSLGLKIREDGHAELLDHLRTTTESLVDPDSLIISNEGLLAFFQRLVTSEKDRITQYVTRKAKQVRSNLPVGHTDWPLACQDESILLAPDNRRQLARDWQSAYQNSFFPGWRTKECRETICTTYLYGIQWIWAYYTGATESVCFNWYYPHSLPPLWEWLTNYLTHKKIPVFPGEVLYRAADIRPVEQLALVLPMESWSLIPPCRERNFPFMAPAFFPSSFSFESVGKRFFWECEARIPIPNIQTLKMLFS